MRRVCIVLHKIERAYEHAIVCNVVLSSGVLVQNKKKELTDEGSRIGGAGDRPEKRTS